MKRILFIVPSFEVGGGILTSLKNLLPLIDTEKYQISVYPITNKGTAHEEISQYAEILTNMGGSEENTMPHAQKSKFIARIVKRVKKTLCSLGVDISPLVFRVVGKMLSAKNYDCVIAFQEGPATQLAYYVNASLKVAWVHSIFSRYAQMYAKRRDVRVYNSFDKIVCVSGTAAEDMKNYAPYLKQKIAVVYNALSVAAIRQQALAFDVDNRNRIAIISVGRIDPVKRFSAIPEIAERLKKHGLSFVWRIIGGITMEDEAQLLKSNIQKYAVADCVEWLGRKSNPYPYIKASQLLVCLSSSETFNYTLAEARALDVPVITTDFPSAPEFVTDGVDGYIVPLENVADMIINVIENKDMLEKIKPNFHARVNNAKLIKAQFESLFK